MTNPLETAALIGVGAQAIKERAKELGLTWSLRPATADGASTAAGMVLCTYDGDVTSLGMVDLVGDLAEGDRVMALAIPPGGNYVIGRIGPIVSAASAVTPVDSVSTATGVVTITTEVLILTGGSFVWEDDTAYKVELRMDVTSSNATNNALWRVRLTNIAGAILGAGVVALRSAVSGSNDVGSDLVVVNTTGAALTRNLVLTLERNLTGSINMNANSTQVAWLRVLRLGPASDYPNTLSIT